MSVDEELNFDCPGCGIDLTIGNVGGYRTYCEKCVSVIPELPKNGEGYYLTGTYPNFKWESKDDPTNN